MVSKNYKSPYFLIGAFSAVVKVNYIFLVKLTKATALLAYNKAFFLYIPIAIYYNIVIISIIIYIDSN